jgi:hypothetical protein
VQFVLEGLCIVSVVCCIAHSGGLLYLTMSNMEGGTTNSSGAPGFSHSVFVGVRVAQFISFLCITCFCIDFVFGAQCCQCHWVVNSVFLLWLSLTFI